MPRPMSLAALAFAFLAGTLATLPALAFVASARIEAAYIDASGSTCLAFALSEAWEADMCLGAYDRQSLMPPALPIGVNAPTGGR